MPSFHLNDLHHPQNRVWVLLNPSVVYWSVLCNHHLTIPLNILLPSLPPVNCWDAHWPSEWLHWDVSKYPAWCRDILHVCPRVCSSWEDEGKLYIRWDNSRWHLDHRPCHSCVQLWDISTYVTLICSWYKPLFHFTCSNKDHWTLFQVSQSLVGCSHAASTIDCGDPTNAFSEVIVQYSSIPEWAQWCSTSVGSQGLCHHTQVLCVWRVGGGVQTPPRWCVGWWQQQMPMPTGRGVLLIIVPITQCVLYFKLF